ncbi:hypothetical protein B0H10DRAFT_1960308 [Mycena sp. CBHHK59/15]|nr:hypothetical protein B0H10DRAFT_1960308 [Mycena sp. CBHHK59/15]
MYKIGNPAKTAETRGLAWLHRGMKSPKTVQKGQTAGFNQVTAQVLRQMTVALRIARELNAGTREPLGVDSNSHREMQTHQIVPAASVGHRLDHTMGEAAHVDLQPITFVDNQTEVPVPRRGRPPNPENRQKSVTENSKRPVGRPQDTSKHRPYSGPPGDYPKITSTEAFHLQTGTSGPQRQRKLTEWSPDTVPTFSVLAATPGEWGMTYRRATEFTQS